MLAHMLPHAHPLFRPDRQLRVALGLLLLLALPPAGCGGQEQLGFGAMNVLSQGVINDPANKTLRFDLLRFGLERFCFEMQQRGVALKLRDGEPVAGRFYATSCQSQLLGDADRQTIAIRYAGTGYGWTNLTGRMGFEAQGFVELAPDFRMHGDAMYIYFRPQNVDANTFRTTLVESQVAGAGMAALQINPDQVGKELVTGQLRRGFTVIRFSERGETDFGMGLIAPGQRPFRPFEIVASTKRTLDNDRTELHSGQQDYIGGFAVEGDDQAITLTLTLDGAPAVDVILLPQLRAQTLLQQYTTQPGPARTQSVPFSAVLGPAQRWQRTIPVPSGIYFLLLDHSDAVGQAAPPQAALDDRAARVDYLIQVGDRP
jgi:hypothetical protein